MSGSAKDKGHRNDKCHCGRRVHYADPEIRKLVEKMIDDAGSEYVEVATADGRRWLVQRHFIALHGLRASEIPTLGFKELTETD